MLISAVGRSGIHQQLLPDYSWCLVAYIVDPIIKATLFMDPLGTLKDDYEEWLFTK